MKFKIQVVSEFQLVNVEIFVVAIFAYIKQLFESVLQYTEKIRFSGYHFNKIVN